MSGVKLSILIPTLNRVRYLPDAVQGALGQRTDASFEVVVHDNGSTDGTQIYMQSLRDSRLRYLRIDGGICMAENWGRAFAAARGEYVCFLSDDDLLDPSFVARHVHALALNDRVSVSFSDHWILDQTGKIDLAATDRSTELWGRSLLNDMGEYDVFKVGFLDMSIPIVSCVFKKSSVPAGAFDPRAASAVDLWLYYLLGASGARATYISDRLASLRVHPGSETARGRLAVSLGQEWTFGNAINNPSLGTHHASIRRRFASALRAIAKLKHQAGELQDARRYARRAYVMQPALRNAAVLALSHFPRL